MRTVEQNRGDRRVEVAMVVPFLDRGHEKIGVIQPVRRHRPYGLEGDRGIQMLARHIAHCLGHIVHATCLEVRRQVGDDFGRYVRRSHSCFDVNANAADRGERPALFLRLGDELHQPGYRLDGAV